MNLVDPDGLSPVTLPPVGPGYNCSTIFITFAAQFGMTIQQLFDSDAGILGMMNYFEQQGSGSQADQAVWAALDWTFLNRWDLSDDDKAWFHGPQSIPSTFAASVTTGRDRSQVFSGNGKLLFEDQLLSILTGSPNSSGCKGLAIALDVAFGTVLAHNGTPIPGLRYIPNPVPGALSFVSNGVYPGGTGSGVTRFELYRLIDGRDTWIFYGYRYGSPGRGAGSNVSSTSIAAGMRP